MNKNFTAALGCLLLFGTAVQAQDTIVPYASPAQQPAQQPAQATAAMTYASPPTYATPAPVYPPVQNYPPSQSYPQVQPYPVYPQPGNPVLPGFQPQQIYPAYNPAVIQTPTQVQSVQYDQYGRVIVNTGSQTVFNSAFNAGRNQVVPGTLRNVNRYEYDHAGNRVHVTGQEWTGLDGQPHANLNRQTITSNGNGTVINNNNELRAYSVDNGSGN